MNTARELATTDLFQGLQQDALATFAGIATETRFGPEEVVYEAGSAGDSIFVIIEGKFRVRVLDDNGDEIDVATLKPGSYFGEMEVIGGIGRTAAVVSEGEGRCYRLDAATLLDTLKRNPGLAAELYRRVCVELVRRLKSTTRDMGYFKARAV